MSALFASGHVVDLVLLLTALEAGAVLAWRRRTGRGPEAGAFLLNLAAGACLMLAVRLALTGTSWGGIGACLAAAGVAHALAVRRSWR